MGHFVLALFAPLAVKKENLTAKQLCFPQGGIGRLSGTIFEEFVFPFDTILDQRMSNDEHLMGDRDDADLVRTLHHNPLVHLLENVVRLRTLHRR